MLLANLLTGFIFLLVIQPLVIGNSACNSLYKMELLKVVKPAQAMNIVVGALYLDLIEAKCDLRLIVLCVAQKYNGIANANHF
jgi:hypothetical protein